jgi:hypothetical protein
MSEVRAAFARGYRKNISKSKKIDQTKKSEQNCVGGH